MQQLRNEVQSYSSENPLNGARVTVASLLGLRIKNNNNNNNSRLSEVAVVANIQQRLQQQRLVNGHANKEDYEDVVRNGTSSPLGDDGYKKYEVILWLKIQFLKRFYRSNSFQFKQWFSL